MLEKAALIQIGMFYTEEKSTEQTRGCGLWAVGNAASVATAGGTPVPLQLKPGFSWYDLLENLGGVIFGGGRLPRDRRPTEEESLCECCRDLRLPFLGIDHGMHVLNQTGGGTLIQDLPKELPQALQHRHPPEEGLRHAINVTPKTHLARFYGEGEIVVNSMHRKAVSRVARGFKVSGRALDGVVEAIEFENDDWFALGVQWLPASASASGLDIQLFRGFLDVCRERQAQLPPRILREAA